MNGKNEMSEVYSSINYELYRIFYITAKCGNITQAARQLYLTQPSVTKHIHHLETDLGCTLFRRSRRGVVLTAEGQTLLRRIEPACRLVAAAEQEIRSLQQLEEGRVTIASTEMSFKSYVLPAMMVFQKAHPKVQIRFSNALNDRMIDMLKNGSIDIAILHEPFRKESFMDLHLIEVMEEYVVCSERFRHAAEEKKTPEELLKYPFISMPKGSSSEEYLRHYFAAAGLDFRPDIELTTVELTQQAVMSGLGIGTLPGRIAHPLLEKGELYRIRPLVPLPKREVYLITNREILPGKAVSAFAEEVLRRVNEN